MDSKKKIFGVYKPLGMTSHDVVDWIRKVSGERRVGHAGTLDPLAKGVLVVGVGREATRELKNAQSEDKEYIAKICLGQVSSTDDEEGDKSATTVDSIPAREEIEKNLLSFRGKILQIPPSYSALKFKGKPAYKYARAGKEIELAGREVMVKEIELLEYAWPHVFLRIVTGPGFYVRALARDLGRNLKTGGYLAGLERTRVGNFTKEKSYALEKLQEILN